MTGDHDDSHRHRRRGRTVSGDEASLWHTVTRSVTPLTRLRHTLTRSLKEHGHHQSTAAAAELPAAPRATAAKPVVAVQPIVRPKPKPQVAPNPAEKFDARTARKLQSGKIEIDSRLDLHGLRQTDARAALLQFLQRAQASGHRYVKVITGKGRPTDATEPFDLFASGDRGVLRRSVPQWLAEPEFHLLVVRTTSAGRGQGGDGALIIHVRQLRRRDGSDR